MINFQLFKSFFLYTLISVSFQSNLVISNLDFIQQRTLTPQNNHVLNMINSYDYIDNNNTINNEVIIAVIDTGIDINHKDLKNIIWSNPNEIINGLDDDNNGYIDDITGWNFCENNNIIHNTSGLLNVNSHGTAIAGIIQTNIRELGINDMANNNNIKIMSLKVLSEHDKNQGLFKNVIKAIQYAEKMGAKICNLSFSSDKYNKELENTINESSMLFVVPAGNSLRRGLNIDKKACYPASYDYSNILTVTSINKNGSLSNFANYGEHSVDIAAPGEDIYTTIPGNQYSYVTGTSFAVPYVTAIAGILYSKYPNITSQEVIKIILSASLTNINLDRKVAKCRVLNGYEAINYNN